MSPLGRETLHATQPASPGRLGALRLVTDAVHVFLPPALGGEHLYLASTLGHVVCMHQESGDLDFMYDLGRPLSAQPCLARGSILLGSLTGDLICVRSGHEDADGWSMWGGNAGHNMTG